MAVRKEPANATPPAPAATVLTNPLRVVPFFRVWLFLLPLLLCLADAGLVALLSRLSRRVSIRLAGVSGLLFVLAISVHLISTGAVTRYPETGVMPDAEAIAQTLDQDVDDEQRGRTLGQVLHTLVAAAVDGHSVACLFEQLRPRIGSGTPLGHDHDLFHRHAFRCLKTSP